MKCYKIISIIYHLKKKKRMNEKNSQIVEQVNAIKLKLNKYTNLKSYDKVIK